VITKLISAFGTGWALSSWVTIFQMAWLREVFPNQYAWFMDTASPWVGKTNDLAAAGWDVAKEFLFATS